MKTTIRFIAIFLFAVSISARAQVGINTTGANPGNSAMLDVSSANMGLLIPRIALTGTNDVTTVISPALSLLVYNTATVSDVTPGFYYYNGTAWEHLVSGIETDPVFTSAIDVSGSLTGDLLKYDGTKFVKFTPSFTQSNYLFNTKYGVKLLARNDAQTDVDFVISPKGNGAILTQQPDGTADGGNERGTYAIDLQSTRAFNTQVAGGFRSALLSGSCNSISNVSPLFQDGSLSVVAGGQGNNVSGADASIVGGYYNTVSGFRSFIGGGSGNVASGSYSLVVGGDGNQAAGMRAGVGGGNANSANGNYSFVDGGLGNTAQSYGESVLGLYSTVGAGNPTAYVSTNRLFVVGNGTADAARSNALTILKNANTTIGGSLTLNGNGTGTSLTLPATRGTSGYVLTTDGIGGTSWTNPASGTVTGVTGTAPIVSSGGNTPAISISAATTSAAGSMSAADKTKLDAITGTNTGNQTITLTGDVTGSGTGSFAATISAASVTNPKMAPMLSNSIKANSTGSLATPTDFPISANTFPSRKSTGSIMAYPITDFAFDILNDADAPSVRTTIGAGTGNGTVTGVGGTAPIVSSGGVSPVISITAATAIAAGSMSAADKAELDAATNANTASTIVARDVSGNFSAGTITAALTGNATTATTSTNLAGGAVGSLPYQTAANATTLLTKGTAGQVLTMNSGATAPQWSTPNNGTVTSVTGTAPISVATGTTTPAISISAATISAAGTMSAADKTKLDGIATNANNYTHPTGDGNLHVPATSTTNNGKVLTAGITAGSLSWTSLPSAPVTSVAGKTGTVTLVSSDVDLGNVENTAISTWTGSTNITTLGTITTGTWSGTSIGITKGGTGAITKTAGFDALSPMTTQGDIIYGGTSGTGTRLAKGTAGQVLTINPGATAPQWSTPTTGTVTSVSGMSPISVATGSTTPAISISPASTSAAGSMSAADKVKLNFQP